MAAFVADTTRGQTVARATLRAKPDDDAALFLLAKLGLNYVWLQLGVLGRKTGWGQYWEARRSVDEVLAADPSHLRARVARAWIDYIVDTRMPFGTRWLLGGGNKRRGLLMMRQAASADGDFYASGSRVRLVGPADRREASRRGRSHGAAARLRFPRQRGDPALSAEARHKGVNHEP